LAIISLGARRAPPGPRAGLSPPPHRHTPAEKANGVLKARSRTACPRRNPCASIRRQPRPRPETRP
jgi:hypothetical protein